MNIEYVIFNVYYIKKIERLSSMYTELLTLNSFNKESKHEHVRLFFTCSSSDSIDSINLSHSMTDFFIEFFIFNVCLYKFIFFS